MKTARSFARVAAVMSAAVLMAAFVYYRAGGRVPFLATTSNAAEPDRSGQGGSDAKPPIRVLPGSKSTQVIQSAPGQSVTIILGSETAAQQSPAASASPTLMSSSKSIGVLDPTMVMVSSKSGSIFTPGSFTRITGTLTLSTTQPVSSSGGATLTFATTQPSFTIPEIKIVADANAPAKPRSPLTIYGTPAPLAPTTRPTTAPTTQP